MNLLHYTRFEQCRLGGRTYSFDIQPHSPRAKRNHPWRQVAYHGDASKQSQLPWNIADLLRLQDPGDRPPLQKRLERLNRPRGPFPLSLHLCQVCVRHLA